MSETVFVLGAGGFIGRHLVEHLSGRGLDVLAATRSPQDFSVRGVRNVVSGWERGSDFQPYLQGCSALIHAASMSTPGSSAAQPQLDGNLRTTLAMVEALQAVQGCRAVFLSSGGTLYGDRATPARESDPLGPRSYHGAGKAAAEHFFHAWAVQYGGTAIMLRPTNVYGPGQPARSGFGIVPAAFDSILSGRSLGIWGDGSVIRDYLYVEDLVDLCASAVLQPMGMGWRAFNAASGDGISINDLLGRIERVTGQAISRSYEPLRQVDVPISTVDISAARLAFGWSPATSLDEGLRRTWQWFKQRS